MIQLNLSLEDVLEEKKRRRYPGYEDLYLHVVSGGKKASYSYLSVPAEVREVIDGVCGDGISFKFLEAQKAAILASGERTMRRESNRYVVSLSDRYLRDAFGEHVNVPATYELAKLSDGTICVYMQFDKEGIA